MNWERSPFVCPILGGYGLAGSNTGLALDSDFTLGTGGDCVGVRFLAPPGGVHVDKVYFFLHAADAEGQNLTCHVANYGASASRAGSSISSVTSAGGTAASKWILFTFTDTTALTANELYWVVVGDAAGNGDGYQIRTRNSSNQTNSSAANFGLGSHFGGYTNDSGFTTNGTTISYPFAFIIVFSDGTVYGHPYTQSTTDTSNTYERGIKITPTEDIKVSGLVVSAGANISTIQILEEATIPGGSIWSGFNSGSAYTLTTNQKANNCIWLPSVTTLYGGNTYRITFRYSSAATYPGYNECEDVATPGADAVACSLGAGTICYTISDGGGTPAFVDYDDAIKELFFSVMVPPSSLIDCQSDDVPAL